MNVPTRKYLPTCIIKKGEVLENVYRLTASSTSHLCNEDVFSRFIEMNCVHGIQVHFS